jgi:hypothetical protein
MPTKVSTAINTATPEQQLTEQHYARLGGTYEDAFFYNETGDYFKWYLEQICTELDWTFAATMRLLILGQGQATSLQLWPPRLVSSSDL